MPPHLAELERPVARSVGWASTHQWVYLRDLLRELVARDMKLRYKGSWLGQAWTLLNPLAELLVLMLVFGSILKLNIPNYAPFLFTGLLAYGWFQTSLYYATGAIVNNRELVRRPGVPSTILPIVTVGSTLIHFLLSLPVLFGLMFLSGVPFTSAILTLPAIIAVEFVLILSLAYPLAAMYVWLRDTQYLLRIALQLLFYMTPVFYEASSIPARLQPYYRLNPMVTLVEAYRDVLMRGRPAPATPLLLVTAASTVLLIAGIYAFRRSSHQFGDQL